MYYYSYCRLIVINNNKLLPNIKKTKQINDFQIFVLITILLEKINTIWIYFRLSCLRCILPHECHYIYGQNENEMLEQMGHLTMTCPLSTASIQSNPNSAGWWGSGQRARTADTHYITGVVLAIDLLYIPRHRNYAILIDSRLYTDKQRERGKKCEKGLRVKSRFRDYLFPQPYPTVVVIHRRVEKLTFVSFAIACSSTVLSRFSQLL